MGLGEHFWKRFNGDVTGVGKAPFRKRFSKFRQARIARKKSFQGVKKIQDRVGIKPDTGTHLMSARI